MPSAWPARHVFCTSFCYDYHWACRLGAQSNDQIEIISLIRSFSVSLHVNLIVHIFSLLKTFNFRKACNSHGMQITSLGGRARDRPPSSVIYRSARRLPSHFPTLFVSSFRRIYHCPSIRRRSSSPLPFTRRGENRGEMYNASGNVLRGIRFRYRCRYDADLAPSSPVFVFPLCDFLRKTRRVVSWRSYLMEGKR